jgi:hypothetical protein
MVFVAVKAAAIPMMMARKVPKLRKTEESA